MCKPLKHVLVALLALLWVSAWADPALYPGIGRNATLAEVAKWNIDVRPDFAGLPKGQGTVAQGQDIWEAKCASCHGVFGESNQVFNPLIGGVKPQDIQTGHVASLQDKSYPARTTLMKLSTVSTLWDYINRAMPWNAPKSLTINEVYAVTAYLLNLEGIVEQDFVLNEKSIALVQQRMPNRDGMTTHHHLWPGNEFGNMLAPDVGNVACMSACKTEVSITSSLPEFARDAHGNLAEQNRLVGQQKGVNTLRVSAAKAGDKVADKPKTATETAAQPNESPAAALALLKSNNCVVCHSLDSKSVGPAFTEVAKKHPGKTSYLTGKIINGGSGVWGSMPMPAQSLSVEDATTIARWLATGAKH
jgi:cytochrome c551/c552